MTKSFCLAAVALGFLPWSASAQQPAVPSGATAPAFTSVLGRSLIKDADGVTSDYTVLGTQPLDSKLVGQKIELRIESTAPTGTSTHTLDINTGKYRSVASMEGFVADIFRRFIGSPAAAGQEIGKVGDVRYGNVIQFAAASADRLDYNVITQGGQKPLGHFSRADVQTFLTILARPPSTGTGG